MNGARQRRAEGRIGGIPIVDLRPPSLAARAKDQSRLAWAVLSLVLVIALIGGIATLASMRRDAALADLASAQAQLQTTRQSQIAYQEVRDVRIATALRDRAAAVGTQYEVHWSDVIGALVSAAPAGTTIGSITAVAPGAAEEAPAPASPLRHPRVATLTIVVAASDVREIAAYARAVDALDIVADVSIDGIVDGLGTLTVNLTETALMLRFTDGLDPSVGDERETGATP